jgi:hypothetical protein
MERTREALRFTRSIRHARAAMSTAVEQGVHLSVSIPREQQRSVTQLDR